MAEVVSKPFADLTTTELHELLRLRCDVFVVEQACAYPELDGRDNEPGTVHHWIEDGDTIVAYLRELTDDGARRLGRVVTAPSARGRGLAAELVARVGAGIAAEIVLDAQSYLVAWYESLGYIATGPEFVEDGIPHVPMRRVQ